MASTPSAPKGPTSIPTYRSKRGWKGYLAEVNREMKKVNWPTTKEATRLTGVVFAVCFIVCTVLFALGTIFEKLVSLVTTGNINA